MTTASTAAETDSTGFSLPQLVANKFRDREFFGHPIGLYVLFLTEMWERFSYYGMISLLVLYMNEFLLKDPARAHQIFGYVAFAHVITSVFGKLTAQQMSSQIFGLYTGFIYVTPIFGGMLADKVCGRHF